jgi:hypothetical protein
VLCPKIYFIKSIFQGRKIDFLDIIGKQLKLLIFGGPSVPAKGEQEEYHRPQNGNRAQGADADKAQHMVDGDDLQHRRNAQRGHEKPKREILQSAHASPSIPGRIGRLIVAVVNNPSAPSA